MWRSGQRDGELPVRVPHPQLLDPRAREVNVRDLLEGRGAAWCCPSGAIPEPPSQARGLFPGAQPQTSSSPGVQGAWNSRKGEVFFQEEVAFSRVSF